MPSTLIRGARVIDPSRGSDAPADILIEDGRIARIGPAPQTAPADRTIDAAGLVACPGFIDLHVHFREPGGEASETIATGAASAAAGGFTRVFCMPNTRPACDSPLVVRYMLDRAQQACGVHVHPIGAVSLGQLGKELTDFGALKHAGVLALSDDGRPVESAEIMRCALEGARETGLVIFDHAEDLALTGDGVMHEGAVSIRLGLHGIPRESEATIVARDCALSRLTGGRLHICHVSNAQSVEAIRLFKQAGAPVTAEVSPHHLVLTDARVRRYDTHAKMKPPLCEDADRLALLAALEDGTIDCIATDHAPHSPASKATTFDAAPFGILGLETAFPVLHSEFVASGRWTLAFLIEHLTDAPARVMGRDLRTLGGDAGRAWGTLAAGSAADITLIDPDREFTYAAPADGGFPIRSRSRNSPWAGERFTGMVVATIVGGAVVHSADGRIAPPAAAPAEAVR
ncbi:MAG: dihydroorotase [Phycisphaerales bacterium]|nr:dihydroorotase [Phycisphaerales bacterium]